MRRWLAPVLTFFLCLVSGLTASAQIPLGPGFRVDTLGAEWGLLHDRSRSVTMAPDGRFIVAWLTPPFAYGDIAARRFNSAGVASGPDFIVNSDTRGEQDNESVASDDAGNFVVVWESFDVYGQSHVFGQRFDAAGVRVGAEFRVDTATFTAGQPFVAMMPGGEFAVVWRSDFIRARRYDASGVPVGAELQVSTGTPVSPDGPSLDFDGAGNFVVAWGERYSSPQVVRARLFTAAGVPQGPEFLVNAGTSQTMRPRVARSRDGSFVVAWRSGYPDRAVVARRFDPTGAPLGPQFVVGPMSESGERAAVDVDADADGDFVVAWHHQYKILGRRFDSAGNGGPQLQVSTANINMRPSVATDPAGNFVVVWRAGVYPPGRRDVMAQRYAAGLMATALSVDAAAGPASDGNGVFEPGEKVAIAPSWLNANFTAQTFTGTAATFTGPGTAGDPNYAIADGDASYGTVASGDTASCADAADCYALGITLPSARPATHWDATFREEIAPANLGAAKNWTLHVGDSFSDIPRSNGFYRFVETLLHHGVTGGCAATTYCPASPTTREQMAVFVLVSKESAGYQPPACATPMFADVPASSPFCPWIEELARRGVVTGCGGGNYCPAAAVLRQQMAVFVLATKEPGIVPPACATPTMFSDVPASSPFCRWIEELARRGVVTGCGGGAYCPTSPVTREQMSVFLSVTFGLLLYGP